MIRGVPITMATIVHYVHYNRLSRGGVSLVGIIIMTTQHVPFHFDTFIR